MIFRLQSIDFKAKSTKKLFVQALPNGIPSQYTCNHYLI